MKLSTRMTIVSQRLRQVVGQVGWHLLCLPIAVTCLFPLGWMLSSSVKTQQTVFTDYSIIPKNPHFDNYAIAWTKGHFGVYFVNSLAYTFVVSVGVVFFAALAAYAFSRFNFRGQGFLYKLILSTMLIPIPGAFVALFILLTRMGLVDRGDNDFWARLGYVMPQINAGLPFGIFILKPFFDKIPKELEESAKVDGCGTLGVFFHIMLPLARPALGVVALLTSLSAWNEFLLAYLIFNRTELMPLQRGLLAFHGAHLTEYPLLMAGMVISIIPIMVIYLLMQRNIIRGITAGALKG